MSAENAYQPATATSSPAAQPGSTILRQEVITYRRELSRLLREGHEGKFVLIKDDQVDSIWDTFDDAYETGNRKFGFGPFLAQPIDPRDLARDFPKEFDVPGAA